MKHRILRYAAVLANLIMMICAAILFTETRGPEHLIALLLFIPPILSLLALYSGPDCEERRLQKQVRKATLRKQLKDLAEFAEEKK